jgi:hypothetical protein
MTVAPNCPVSHSQDPGQLYRNGGLPQGGVTFSGMPRPVDLDSLIKTVNALREVLRQFTGQWTVNNVQQPGTPNHRKEGNTYYSQYPEWDQVGMQTMTGYIFHKDQNGTDYTQKAYVNRINQINYHNRSQEDPDFQWAYYKQLDAGG